MFKFSKILAAGMLALALGGATAAMAKECQILIINDVSRQALTELYATKTPGQGWGSDILGSSVIGSYHQRVIKLDGSDGHCTYNLKAVFSNGGEVVRENADLYALRYWHFQ